MKQGENIPKMLPLSTLACPPSGNYIKQFISAKENLLRGTSISLTSGKALTSLKQNGSIDNINGFNSQNNIKASSTINLKKNINTEIYIKKWVEYSSKYGLGYLLSNGSAGVFFNDCTKIVLDPKKEYFEYIEKKVSDKTDIIVAYSLKAYPKELHKKVTLLQHFRSYLEGTRTQPSGPSENPQQIPEDQRNSNIINLKKWMKTRHAIMFRLSNKIIQVDFQDKTQIILSSESKLVSYVNKKMECSQYPIATALESDNQEMAKRLKYTKEILTHMLNNNSNKDLKSGHNLDNKAISSAKELE